MMQKLLKLLLSFEKKLVKWEKKEEVSDFAKRAKIGYKTGFGVGRVRRHRRVYHNEGHGLRDRLIRPQKEAGG